MSAKKRGLGRGLDALLGNAATDSEPAAGEELRELALDALQAGRHQPRRHFDEAALAELAASIAAQGVVQPLVVRPIGGERYEIVAGERRWRAARIAGLGTVPAVVRSLDERAAMATALVENIQRADLNPLEESEALHRLIRDCDLTHEEVAKAVGRSRAAVSNLLRLMELEPEVQQRLRSGEISLGHAKVLLGVSGSRQVVLAKAAVDRQWSVRQLESMLRLGANESGRTAPSPGHPLEAELKARIGLPVRVQQGDGGAGRVTVKFRTEAELASLLQKLR
jgi:ParB family chromosome partitioning protein